MNVQVKLFSIDNPRLKEDIDFTLHDGATVNTLLQACAADERVNVKYENLKIASFIVNKVSAKIDKVLHDGDKVLILRPFGGGVRYLINQLRLRTQICMLRSVPVFSSLFDRSNLLIVIKNI